MRFRRFKISEISKFRELDRRETINEVYVIRKERLELKEEAHEIPSWTEEEQTSHMQVLRRVLENGGMAYAAFEDSLVVGLILLDYTMVGKNKKFFHLVGLIVSKEYRKQGIGSRLLDLIILETKYEDRDGLYTAVPFSKSTVDFYRSRGFSVVKNPDKYVHDPNSTHIHMKRKL